jgi:prepilin-type N-terminal cleavage/methylation domain-containing protein
MRKGFTIIELLVVISIIALLSSIIMVVVSDAREDALRSGAEQEIIQIVNAASAAKNATDHEYLYQVTGTTCTVCDGEAQLPISLRAITDAVGTYQGLDQIDVDPWGEPYELDENEGEDGSTDCDRDTITAPGGSLTYAMDYGSAYCRDNPVGEAGWQ